jgi:hypothetical protein
VGAAFTFIVQLAAAGRDIPFVQVPPLTIKKGAGGDGIELSAKGPEPVFITLTVCVAEPHAATMPKSIVEDATLIWPHSLTEMAAVQFFVEPAPLSAVKVQLCVLSGVKFIEPLAPLKIPLLRLPVQL